MSNHSASTNTTENTNTQPPKPSPSNRYLKYAAVSLIILPVLYILLSGPILAGAIALGERGWLPEPVVEASWYFHWPLLMLIDKFDPIENLYADYITWWFEAFGTQMPG